MKPGTKHKIGLFGGTFDPVHHAHLLLAEWIKEELSLSKIIFIPAFIPPHKIQHPITPAELRLEMVQLAISDNPAFAVSRVEIDKGDISYSIDTIMYFRRHLNITREQLFFIMGSDNLHQFSSWKSPDKIIDNCQVVVYKRINFDFSEFDPEYKHNMLLLQNPLINLSSSAIRERVLRGQSIKYMVPPLINEFISHHELYK